MKYSRWVLLITSFFEGFIRFPMDALMFFYVRNRVVVDVEPSKAIVHLQWCVYYYSMSVLPTVLSTKSPAFLINFISSSLTLLSFVVISIFEFMYDPPAAPNLLFFDGDRRTSYSRLSQAELTSFDLANKYLKLTLIILLAVFGGAKTLTSRHILIKQFSFPADTLAYNKFRVHRSTAMGLGKILGLLITVYFSRHGPHLHFRNFFLVLAMASAIDCMVLVSGFFLPDLRLVDRIPRGLLKFFKLQRRVIKEKFFSKQVQEAQLNEQQEAAEEWKALVKVLPLFIPAVIIIAVRDQRYTQYINQEEMLVPDVKAEVVLPTVLIFVMYPVTKMLGTIIVDGIIMPYMKKKGRPLTSVARSLTGFIFVTLSLAAATILQCHVEKTKSPIMKGDDSHILLYNTCECPAMITVRGSEKEITSPPMSLKKIEIPPFLVTVWMTVRVECGSKGKYVTKANIQIRTKEINEYLILKDNPRSISVEEIKSPRFTQFFNIHTMLRVIVVPFQNNYSVEFTDVIIENENEHHSYPKTEMRYPFFFKDQRLNTGRYFIIVDDITLLDININYGASLTCLVSTKGKYRMPNIKLFTLMPPNSISIYYQIPQTLILALSDVMLESPTFVYASNAVPRKWWNLVNDLWLSCGGTGNVITAIAVYSGAINRLVMVFLFGFGSCWLSVAIFVQVSSSMYKVNYEFQEEPEETKTTKS